jgi:hypothetical protein
MNLGSCASLGFIVWCDRDSLPMKRGAALDQGGSRSKEGDPDSIWPGPGLRSTQHQHPIGRSNREDAGAFIIVLAQTFGELEACHGICRYSLDLFTSCWKCLLDTTTFVKVWNTFIDSWIWLWVWLAHRQTYRGSGSIWRCYVCSSVKSCHQWIYVELWCIEWNMQVFLICVTWFGGSLSREAAKTGIIKIISSANRRIYVPMWQVNSINQPTYEPHDCHGPASGPHRFIG